MPATSNAISISMPCWPVPPEMTYTTTAPSPPPADAPVADHGGSLARAAQLFPDAAQPWVDLSTGINPHSYPHAALPAAAFTALPEEGAVAALCAVAAQAYGAQADHVVAAPGTQILLPRVAALVPPGTARVLAPTYAEHRRAAALAGHDVAAVTEPARLAGARLAIVVNPNNPDGRVLPRGELLALAARLKAENGLLVVDEAFMDIGPRDESVAGDVAAPEVAGALVVLRSFGKFFGLAGVRLGFALAAPALAQTLRERLGPWAVSGPALALGATALADLTWQAEMRARLSADAARLDALLAVHGAAPAGGTALFRLVRHADSAGLFQALGDAGLYVRRFTAEPLLADALRIGLPPDAAAWDRLATALARWSRRPS